MAVDFKGAHFPKSVIMHAVFFYVRYPVSYRDLQEILAERGVAVDHATLNRWVTRYAPQIAEQAQLRKRRTASSWRVDETYLKVRGKDLASSGLQILQEKQGRAARVCFPMSPRRCRSGLT